MDSYHYLEEFFNSSSDDERLLELIKKSKQEDRESARERSRRHKVGSQSSEASSSFPAMADKGEKDLPISKKKVAMKTVATEQVFQYSHNLMDSYHYLDEFFDDFDEKRLLQLIKEAEEEDRELNRERGRCRRRKVQSQSSKASSSFPAIAYKGGKDLPISKKNVTMKAVATEQASQKWNENSPMEEDDLVQIDSSDSESDLVKEKDDISSKGLRKTSKETTKSGKKSVLNSLKTGVKFAPDTPDAPATPLSKGDWGKSGKAYTPGKAGGKGGVTKASDAKPPVTEVDLKLELDLPKNARVLMDCEAAIALQGIHESLTVLSEDPSIKMPDSFNKALEYCKARNNYTDSESARKVLETLKERGFTDGEICMIGNICPENIDEVYALISSLKCNKKKNEKPIREVLVNLSHFMQS